jgi:3-oxosteroid 1-dehydrogenase
MSMSDVVDVLVVGSGNGALTAALCAHELGVKNVLVIEKSDQMGGTSATSGGMIWIPSTRSALEGGAQDSPEAALDYLRRAIPTDVVPADMLETWVREGSKMIDFLQERTRVRYRSLAHLSGFGDLFARSWEPEPVYRNVLGTESHRLRDSHRMHCIFDRISMTAVETLTLLARMRGWRSLLLRMIWKYGSDVPWVFTHRRSRRLTCGAAGIARLRWSMMDRGMPLWFNASLQELLTDECGRVVGASVIREGHTVLVHAKRGVILATGGFEHNQSMRERYLPQPTSYEASAAPGTNTGDALRAALKIGAATRSLEAAYWCSTFKVPDHRVPWLARIEKSYAGTCVVNRRGLRIANESQDSIAFQRLLFRKHSEAEPQIPAWLIFDARVRRSKLMGPLYSSRLRPDWMLPKQYFACGFVTRAATIRSLAYQTGIDPVGLECTVAAMNEYARTGTDLEFGRGESEYDRMFGDPAIKPNPCLAPITEAPFYALRIEPGDFGTAGGLTIDTHARVLDRRGQPIPGLYAAGNCAASMAPTYPAGGCTLGPAMTFAWRAAQHIAGCGVTTNQ